MPAFKNKEEYERWKAEKARGAKETGTEKQINQSRSTLTLSTNIIVVMAVMLVLITATIVYFVVKPSPQAAKNEEVAKPSPSVSTPAPLPTKTENVEKKVVDSMGKISGSIFATMQSGDVKRAAGTEIVLIKEDGSLISKYEQLQRDCRTEINPLFESYMKSNREVSDVLTPGRYSQGAFASTHEENMKRQKLYEDATARCFTNIRVLLSNNTVQRANTDVNGTFLFSNVPFGKFYLYSQFDVFNNKLEWLEPVDLRANEIKIDLSNNNKRKVITY